MELTEIIKTKLEKVREIIELTEINPVTSSYFVDLLKIEEHLSIWIDYLEDKKKEEANKK